METPVDDPCLSERSTQTTSTSANSGKRVSIALTDAREVPTGETADASLPTVDSTEWTGVAKDSRRAWVVCFAAFTIQVFIVGILHVFGVFFVALLEEFRCSKGAAAWVGSIAYGLTMLLAPISSSVINNFGSHVSVMVGSVICTGALLITSWAPSIGVMYFTFSVIYGFGNALAYTPTMTIAGDYFDKYFTVATGFMVAGSSTGTLLLSPISQGLIDWLGWRGAMRVLSVFTLVGVICGFQFTPKSKRPRSTVREIKKSPARRLMKDLHLWKNKVFVFWVVAITLVMFGYYIPYVHLVSHVMDLGYSRERGSVLMMVLGGSTATGRVLFGKIVDYGYLNRLHMHQLSLVVTGTGVMLLPLITSFWGLLAYVVTVGLVDGCMVVLLPVLTTTLAGAENKVAAWGYLVAISSITFTLGPPTAGWLYDMTGSYDLAFHVAGVPIIMGAIIMFFIPWAQRTATQTNIMTAAQSYDVMTQALSEDELSIVSDQTTHVVTPPGGPLDASDVTIDFSRPKGGPTSGVHTDAVHQRLHDVADILEGDLGDGNKVSGIDGRIIARPRPRPSGSQLASPVPGAALSLVLSPRFSRTGDMDIAVNDLMNIQVHSPDATPEHGQSVSSNYACAQSLVTSPVNEYPPWEDYRRSTISANTDAMSQLGTTPLSGLELMFQTSLTSSLATSPLEDSFVHVTPGYVASSGQNIRLAQQLSGASTGLTAQQNQHQSSHPALVTSPPELQPSQRQQNQQSVRTVTSEDLIFGAPTMQ